MRILSPFLTHLAINRYMPIPLPAMFIDIINERVCAGRKTSYALMGADFQGRVTVTTSMPSSFQHCCMLSNHWWSCRNKRRQSMCFLKTSSIECREQQKKPHTASSESSQQNLFSIPTFSTSENRRVWLVLQEIKLKINLSAPKIWEAIMYPCKISNHIYLDKTMKGSTFKIFFLKKYQLYRYRFLVINQEMAKKSPCWIFFLPCDQVSQSTHTHAHKQHIGNISCGILKYTSSLHCSCEFQI